jgi:hypothetical protein
VLRSQPRRCESFGTAIAVPSRPTASTGATIPKLRIRKTPLRDTGPAGA